LSRNVVWGAGTPAVYSSKNQCFGRDFKRGRPFKKILNLRGYRITAIMRPCQGRETGATPVTRSKKVPRNFGGFLFFYVVFGRWFKGASSTIWSQHNF